jgi:hypothetical protein
MTHYEHAQLLVEVRNGKVYFETRTNGTRTTDWEIQPDEADRLTALIASKARETREAR